MRRHLRSSGLFITWSKLARTVGEHSNACRKVETWSNSVYNCWSTSHQLHHRVREYDLMASPVKPRQAILAAGLCAKSDTQDRKNESSKGVWKRFPTLSSEWDMQIMSHRSGYIISFKNFTAAPFTLAPSRVTAMNLPLGYCSCVDNLYSLYS